MIEVSDFQLRRQRPYNGGRLLKINIPETKISIVIIQNAVTTLVVNDGYCTVNSYDPVDIPD